MKSSPKVWRAGKDEQRSVGLEPNIFPDDA